MLDYLAVKKFHALKLVEDAEGDGRVESAFYHTVKMVYLKGVEDTVELCSHGGVSNEEAVRRIIGVIDRRAKDEKHSD